MRTGVLHKSRLVAAVLLVPLAALAEQHVDELKHSLRLEYQYGSFGAIDTPGGLVDLGETTSHALLLSGTYSINDRWTLFGSIPYVRKRHKGALAHNLSEFVNFTPPDRRIVDDGQYHGGFQDLYLGAQYLAVDGPVSVSTYAAYGSPLNDYPIYGNAIIGKRLWEMPLGVNIEFTPHFSDWSFHADISYVISEKLLGVDLNYWLLHASARYYVTRRFAPRIFLTQRNAPNALDLADIPGDWDNAPGYHHDRILKHGYLNAGIGFDYIISDRYSISATYFETLEQDVVANLDLAYTVGLTYRF